MPTPRERLKAILEDLTAEAIASGAPDAAAINAGDCEDVADEAVRRMDEAAPGAEALGIDNLMRFAGFGDPEGMDWDLIRAHWPAIVTPEGMDEADVDRMAREVGFSAGTHVWVVLEGRHHDVEAPFGVDNPFDLPFFRRIVENWKAGAYSPPAP